MKTLQRIKFLIIPLILVIFIVNLPNIIKVKNVICENQFGQCSHKVTDKIFTTRNVSLYKSKKLLNEAFKNNVFVLKFKIHFTPPWTLKVSIIERFPKYAVQQAKEGKIAEISDEGMVLDFVDSTSLVKMIIDSDFPPIGEVVDNKIYFALKLVSSIFTSYPIKNATYKEDYLDIELDTGFSVLFPLEGDRDLLLGSFVLIYDELTKNPGSSKIETSSVRIIDLRYNKPVLRAI